MILYLFILIISRVVLIANGVTVESLSFREFVRASGLSITT